MTLNCRILAAKGLDKNAVNSERMERIYQIIKQFQSVRMNIQTSGDISRSELFTLNMIRKQSQFGNVSISALSEWLMISKSAVSQLINSLEDKGYVERIHARNDRRLVLVSLTETGKACLDRELIAFVNKLTQLFSALGESDTDELLRILAKLYDIVMDKEHSCQS